MSAGRKPGLGEVLEQTWQLDRRRAFRALLLSPMVPARGTSEPQYRLVRRFEDDLREWFTANTGWRLSVSSTAARLHKRVDGVDATRPLVDRRKVPFTRRRYVLFCLALAVLERSGAQTTLSRLADELIVEVGGDGFAEVGLEFSLTGRAERSDLVQVIRRLLDLGALRRVEGDEQRFEESGADVLYDIEHGVLSVIPQFATPPSRVDAIDCEERLAAVVEPPLTGTEELRRRGVRHSLTRRLLDNPVLFYDSLSEEARAYLTSQRALILGRIEEATGLVAEVRREGIALLDPDNELTDVRVPDHGAPGHLALLLATHLAAVGTTTYAGVIAFVDAECASNAGIWGSTIRARPRSELADEALGRLRDLGLITVVDATVTALPVLARFRLGEPRQTGPSR